MQQGLQPVDGPREPGLGRLPRLEFVPECPEFLRLVRRQKPEYPIGGDLLAGFLIGQRGCVIDERVAGIDLDDVVDQQHLQHARQVDGLVGMLRKHHGHQRELPAVLGVVFAPGSVEERRAAEHLLERLDLQDEQELRPQPLVGKQVRHLARVQGHRGGLGWIVHGQTVARERAVDAQRR